MFRRNSILFEYNANSTDYTDIEREIQAEILRCKNKIRQIDKANEDDQY